MISGGVPYTDVSSQEFMSFRVTQLLDPINEQYGPSSTSIGVIMMDDTGVDSRIESQQVSVIPYPYTHANPQRSMMRTVRVPLACMAGYSQNGMLNLKRLGQIGFDSDARNEGGVLGFDELHFTH